MGGGIAQAYSTMGFCTFMKTVEVTRQKSGRLQIKAKALLFFSHDHDLQLVQSLLLQLLVKYSRRKVSEE
jgi:hypothetical protein